MKYSKSFFIGLLLLVVPFYVHAQHKNTIAAQLDPVTQIIKVQQELTYYNQSNDTLAYIRLNDWNNAYSSKDSPMARRFTDEFIKAFHLAKDADRGYTTIYKITDDGNYLLGWNRPDGHPDIADVSLKNPLYPGQKVTLSLTYEVKVPNDRFTGFGYNDKKGAFNLRDWYLNPARYENGFVTYSNENLDDIANGDCDYTVKLSVPKGSALVTDLAQTAKITGTDTDDYTLQSFSSMGFNLVVEPVSSYEVFNFPEGSIATNLSDNHTTGIQRADIVKQIADFTALRLGKYPYDKLLVTQADYDRNPVYGINQLPSFLRPFPDSFIYEVRFLKTYVSAYLKATLKLDPRRDNWVYDAIQTKLIIDYVQQYHPDDKMMGNLGHWRILRGHHLFNLTINEQYTYLWLIMARKNLDQPIGDPKNTLIKFNAQISGKYRAGLSLNYLDDYLGNDVVARSISEFYTRNIASGQTNRNDLEVILQQNATKDISWFFNTVVDTRDIIDYKFGPVKKEGDSLRVTLKNVTGAKVPVSLYGLKKQGVVFKQWVDGFVKDTTITIPSADVKRLGLNYNEAIPEYNARNNYKKLEGFFPNNKPLKFTFFQDLEDPKYNQLFYVPSFVYNLYDGVSFGIRFHNKSVLEKPFIFDVNPAYSTNTGQLIGGASLLYNQYLRDGRLYNIRYTLGGNTYHYAPDAQYIKFTPGVQFRIRNSDLRRNQKEFITARQVTVWREKSDYVVTEGQNENYSVFNLRYTKFDSEITKHYNVYTDLQMANAFGKVAGEVQFRRLFNNNRQVNLRVFAGAFLYRHTDSDYFSFGLDRPTDYLFDYNYYGRSETTGLFSQQFIMADGGFKSKLHNRFANQFMTTVNGSFNIWNWIELYGDAGLIKSKNTNAEFVYDSGVRLNLVTDYFELYFPVYSTNGFEPKQGNYGEKIRFVVTLSPGTLLGLFTRKWL